MSQKLRVTIQNAFALAKSSNSKGTARGYNHTYVEHTGINIPNLATYPSDYELSSIASDAMDEAEALVNLLGISPFHLYSDRHLFSIPPPVPDLEEEPEENENEDKDPSRKLHELLRSSEVVEWWRHTDKNDDAITALSSAAVALSVNDSMIV